MNKSIKNIVNVINPAKPAIPDVRSFPPLIAIIDIPAVAFIIPCIIDAAITDFDLMVMYSKSGDNKIHRIIIMNIPICGCCG